MDRFWSRVGARAAAVGLLLAGLVGGVYLGRDRDGRRAGDSSASIVRVDDARRLRQRQGEHAAARALQRRAQGDAAQKAAIEARAVAAKARRLETRVIAARKAAADAKKAAATKRTAETGGPVPFTGRIPDSCTEFTGSRAVGCTLMLNAGFETDQFRCLNKLWNRESGWNYRASSRGSGAYGIPQALPGRKMASVGADWKTSPATQITWGLGYIRGRYHTPCAAWSHFETVGSY